MMVYNESRGLRDHSFNTKGTITAWIDKQKIDHLETEEMVSSFGFSTENSVYKAGLR